MNTSDLSLGTSFLILAAFLGWHSTATHDHAGSGETYPEQSTTSRAPEHSFELRARVVGTNVSESPYRKRFPDLLESTRRVVEPMIDQGKVHEARSFLMREAARASNDRDRSVLGYHLALLGELSIGIRDLTAAKLFLDEAVAAFEHSNDRMGLAYGYMQLGRMHIESRVIARQASDAYNQLLLARNQMHKYQYVDAESNLLEAVRSSLDISRYGTAASALKSLARLQRSTGRQADADASMLKAAELHAFSGQGRLAHGILETLTHEGIDPTRIQTGKQAVRNALVAFRISTEQVAQARDYHFLYHQYKNAGDEARAWEFRMKADEALGQVSKRAMYHRQPDVIALLYESNHSMKRADTLVRQASYLFISEGAEQLAREAIGLSSRIF